VRIGKVLVDRIGLEDLLSGLAGALQTATRRTILNANANAVTLAETNQPFATALAKADVVFCDGYSVYLASRLFRAPIRERLTYADITESLARTCHSNGASLFLLGAKEGVGAAAARRLEAAIPGLKVHHHHGYFAKDAESSREVVELVNRSGAEVLFVGFGMPAQELWITAHRDELAALVVFSVGAAIDYAAGTVPRGPRWMTQHGLEWLARLAVEPRRLWRRYLLGLPEFGLVIARQWMGNRFQQMGAETR
jgi:N-acetylglucosaminyldiphosphoundecaprenol N-acetyl-beta-D-mannosaminyltransferase